MLKVWSSVLLGLLSLGLLLPAAALADAAVKPDDAALQQRYRDADMVSLVKVNYIGDMVNPAMSVHGLIAVQGYVYTAQLLQQWKGVDERPNFKIRVNLSDCHSRLSVGNEYVVFGKLTRDYDFQSYSCDDLVPREQAAGLLGALDKVRDKQLAKNPKRAPPSI